MPRLLGPIPLHRPHLVLAHAGRDDRFAFRQTAQLVDHILRMNDIVILFIGERIFFVQRLNFLDPFRMVQLGHAVGHFRKHTFQIAHNRAMRMHDLGDVGRIDIDMNLFGVGRKRHESFPSHDRSSKRDPAAIKQIAALHRDIGAVFSVHAERTQMQHMVRRKKRR